MLLTTICDYSGKWLGQVQEDAYDELNMYYVCTNTDGSVYLVLVEDTYVGVTGIRFPSEEAVLDAFITYNKERDVIKARERELKAKSAKYVWDNGELRKM